MNWNIAIFKKALLAYNAVCKPFCKELGLPQTAFDILMFFGNNPEYKTASEIVEVRHIKANLVSVHVERLVQDGYLIRQSVKDDRRKTELICTEKAQAIIRKGRQLQQTFLDRLFIGMDDDFRNVFLMALETMEENLNEILEEEEKR